MVIGLLVLLLPRASPDQFIGYPAAFRDAPPSNGVGSTPSHPSSIAALISRTETGSSVPAKRRRSRPGTPFREEEAGRGTGSTGSDEALPPTAQRQPRPKTESGGSFSLGTQAIDLKGVRWCPGPELNQ